MILEPGTQLVKVERTSTLVDLHGVAAAEADGSPGTSVQIPEVPACTGAAVGVAVRLAKLAYGAGPHVNRGKPRAHATRHDKLHGGTALQ
jgi:hypothetical protein